MDGAIARRLARAADGDGDGAPLVPPSLGEAQLGDDRAISAVGIRREATRSFPAPRSRTSSAWMRGNTDDHPQDRVWVEFNFKQFAVSMLIHTFFPLSVPVVVALYGWRAADNFHMLPNRSPSSTAFYYHSFFTPIVTFLLVAASCTGWLDVAKGGPYAPEIFVPLAYFVLRNFVISNKYAWISESEWEFFLGASRDEADEFSWSMMLLAGWAAPGTRLLHDELVDAALRQRVSLKDCGAVQIMTTPGVKERMAELLSVVSDADATALKYTTELGPPGERGGKVDLRHLGTAIIRHAAKIGSDDGAGIAEAKTRLIWWRIRYIGYALAAVHSLLPLLSHWRDYRDGKVKLEDWEGLNVTVTVLAVWMRFYFYWLLWMYLFAAVMDYHRRYVTLHKMTKLVIATRRKKVSKETIASIQSKRGGQGGLASAGSTSVSALAAAAVAADEELQRNRFSKLEWEPPMLDVRRPDVLLCWYRLRVVLQDYGLRYHYRLQAFATACAAMMVILVLMMFASALSGGGIKAFDDEANFMVMTMTMFNVVVVFSLIILIIVFGDWANEETALQMDSLVQKEVELTETRRALDERHAERMQTQREQRRQRAESHLSGPDHEDDERASVLTGLDGLGMEGGGPTPRDFLKPDDPRVLLVERSRDMVKFVRKGIKTMDRFYPIMVLQIRADRFLLQGIAIGVSSVLAIAARLMSG